MFCRTCGAQLPDSAQFCTVCGNPIAAPAAEASPQPEPIVYAPTLEPMASPTQSAPQPAKPGSHLPPVVLRIVMQFFSCVLCIVLTVSLLINGLLLDLRYLTSDDGLEETFAAILGAAEGSEAITQRSEESLDAIADIVYDAAASQEDIQLDFSKEELRLFLEESTVPEFLTDELSDYAMDVIHGTQNAEIHTDELMDLLEENEEALEKDLGIRLTEEEKQALAQELYVQIEEQDLNATIHQTVDQALEENLNIDLHTLREAIEWITSDKVLIICLVISLLLMGMLCGLNYYNIGNGLTWCASAFLSAVSVLVLPVVMIDAIAEALAGAIPGLSGIESVAYAITPALSTVHTWFLIAGAILLLVGIGLRVTFWALRRHRAAAA